MIDVKIVKTKEHYNDALSVRRDVFINEQEISPELEIDELENESIHLVAYDDDVPVGAGRVRIVQHKGKAERICVLSSYRGKKIGQAIMLAAEEFVRLEGLDKMALNAQKHAVPFYEKLDYTITSDEFMDAGIPHFEMEKTL